MPWERTFGHIPGYTEGSCFGSRVELSQAGLHRLDRETFEPNIGGYGKGPDTSDGSSGSLYCSQHIFNCIDLRGCPGETIYRDEGRD